MDKLSPEVRREVRFVALWTVGLSLLMQAVFVILGVCGVIAPWDYTVLLGNLLGDVIAVGNFLGMAVTVQKAVGREKKQAESLLRMSMGLRYIGIGVLAGLGVILSVFHPVAVLVPLFFPRIAVAVQAAKQPKTAPPPAEPPADENKGDGDDDDDTDDDDFNDEFLPGLGKK